MLLYTSEVPESVSSGGDSLDCQEMSLGGLLDAGETGRLLSILYRFPLPFLLHRGSVSGGRERSQLKVHNFPVFTQVEQDKEEESFIEVAFEPFCGISRLPSKICRPSVEASHALLPRLH